MKEEEVKIEENVSAEEFSTQDVKFGELDDLKLKGDFKDADLAFRVNDGDSNILVLKSERRGQLKSTSSTTEISLSESEKDKIRNADYPNYYLYDRRSGKFLLRGVIKVSKKDKS